MVIEELNLRNQTFFRRRRHSFLHPLDVRDFLEPDKYHRYDEIIRYLKVKKIFLQLTVQTVGYLQDISTRYSFVELLDLGRSHENRSILAVKIGWSRLGENTPSGVLDGGMHGREFISPATGLYGEATDL